MLPPLEVILPPRFSSRTSPALPAEARLSRATAVSLLTEEIVPPLLSRLTDPAVPVWLWLRSEMAEPSASEVMRPFRLSS